MQNTYVQISSATSGTVPCQNTGQDVILIHEAGVTLSMTIAMPDAPVDTQKVSIISTGGVTTLSLTTLVGSIINAITTLVAGTPVAYMYIKSQNKWYKVS